MRRSPRTQQRNKSPGSLRVKAKDDPKTGNVIAREDNQTYEFEGVHYDTYQEMVNAKRRRNQKVLEESGLLTAVKHAKTTASTAKQLKQGLKKNQKRNVATGPGERRVSKRLAGISSDGKYVDDERAGRFTIAKDGGVVEEGSEQELEKDEFYRNRINDGADISVKEAVELTGSKWVQETSVKDAEEFVRRKLVPAVQNGADSVEESSPRSVAGGIRKMQEESDDSSLIAKIDDLSVDDVDSCVAKVVPDRILGIAAHPSPTSLIVAAGDKSGSVGIWNVNAAKESSEESNDGVHLFRFHSGAAGCLEWTPSGNRLFSSSYDGTVRVLDLQKEAFVQTFATYDDSSDAFKEKLGYKMDNGDYRFWTQFGCIDPRSATDECFFLSTSAGTALHVDLRVGKKGQITFHQDWSDKKINTLSLHANGYSMISAGLDCTVKLFDLRHLKSKSSALSPSSTPPVAQYNGVRSINSAFFSPSGTTVVATTMNNKLDILESFHLSKNSKTPVLPFDSISHDNKTGRWLSTFMARFHPSLDIFCVGSMKQPRRMEIFSQYGDQLRDVQGDALTAVVSRCCFHASTDKLIAIGGNSSGRVTIIK